MPQCYVSSCSNYYGKTRGNSKIIYHMIPTDTELLSKWIKVCRTGKEPPPPHARVCSEHFSENCYQRDLQHELLGLPLRRKLKFGAIPDLNLPSKNVKHKKQVLKDVDCQNQVEIRKTKGKKITNTKNYENISSNVDTKQKESLLKKLKEQVSFLEGINIEAVAVTTKNDIPKHTGKFKKKERMVILRKVSNDKNDTVNDVVTIPVDTDKTESANNSTGNYTKRKYKSEGNSDETNTKKLKSKYQTKENIQSDDTSEVVDNRKHIDKIPKLKKIKEENINKIRRPMRSSIRIAKKKSIESLSDSFTEKINNMKECNKGERFTDKLKFMAKLELKHEKNNHEVIDLDKFFEEIADKDLSNLSLNKMQIMENVVEGCNVQPSSPGHAEERDQDVKIKSESVIEETDNKPITDNDTDNKDIEDNRGKSKSDNISNGVKEEPDSSDIHDDNYSNSSSPTADNNKRKSETEEYPIKKLRSEIQENFHSRDKIINDFIEMADCNNFDQINSFSEQLLAEIKTLNEFAKEKEREWNNIIHLKKLKEELLLRMQRKKQVLMLSEKTDYAEQLSESQNGNIDERLRTLPQSVLRSNYPNSKTYSTNSSPNGNLYKQKLNVPKTQNNIDLMSSVDKQGKKLTLDVQSIIADYRQRHPETVPRRGRRIRCSPNDSNKLSNSIMNFSSMALGSGAQVRQGDVNNDLGILLNSINMSRHETANKLPITETANLQDTVSFKDMLLQFAKLSQNERNELIQNAIKPPPPYPEVTVHPVPTSTPPPTNSLLHGILTKSPTKQNSKSSFSPTLARLLTAPERNSSAMAISTPISNSTVHPSNMSISEILSTSKACNEITITPVDTQYDSTATKGKSMEEDETEDSADRLVIDENNDTDSKKQNNSDNNSDGGDEVPLCQGCNQKSAQFVCAGCGNQWYCSRDCQVSAWDEHSEVCSG
ncbi:uncharacterized protein LOC130903164 isoform X1 [Diorhabda carinulata]|uniref:uncharacterized protein LOC130903164 isoform X1 n=1 Tax=Diorhabda carinulata TaxID=1163345 RepID=UPI0025A2EDE5|nr:uncharacterized protein LOC130903164 isoform X1 [Diorhabda carinulata]